jgi:hypothetical protein
VWLRKENQHRLQYVGATDKRAINEMPRADDRDVNKTAA